MLAGFVWKILLSSSKSPSGETWVDDVFWMLIHVSSNGTLSSKRATLTRSLEVPSRIDIRRE